MQYKIIQSKMSCITRITLSVLIIHLQLIFPLNDVIAASNTEEPGIVTTPESQQPQEPLILPYVAGDAILISTYPDTSSFLNGIFPIDDQGYVEFPIGDRINITKMNEQIFVKYLRDNYQNYMLSPNLFVKPMIRVAVVGGFVTPGFYYVDNKMSLWDLIKLAGGPNHEEAIKDINWERNGEKVIEDVTPFLEHGVSLKTMGFQSGDLVWAPSPEAEDTWDFIITKILPVAAFSVTLYLVWMTYQTNVLIATRP
jgi:protein involved in polysaccharide export with SLBB domain